MVLPTVFPDARTRAARLAERTALGVGGTPEFLFEPDSLPAVGDVVSTCRRHGVPVRVLGGGTNLLIASDDVIDGAVVDTRKLRATSVHDDHVVVGAGCPFPGVVRRAAAWQVPSLSGCPGIPGSVGGAAVMNAGGRHGSIGDALSEVEAVDARGRTLRHRVRSSDLGYRATRFLEENWILTAVVLRRDAGLSPERELRRRREALAEKQEAQPLSERSAGCIFRNPTVEGRPVSAGRLIDRAGLKGRRVGGAVVSDVHANFILNDGSATARDVRALIDEVRRTVRDRTGVELVLEVRIWS